MIIKVEGLETIEAKLDALFAKVEVLENRALGKPPEEVGDLNMAAQLTGLSRKTIYGLTSQRLIPHRKVRGKLVFKRAEIMDWMDEGFRPTVQQRMQNTTALVP